MTSVEEAKPHYRDPRPGDQCACGCDAARVWVLPDGNEWPMCDTQARAYSLAPGVLTRPERTDFGADGSR